MQELDERLEKVHCDTKRHEQLVNPHDIPPSQPPEFHLETGPPKWKEAEDTVRCARSASAPGPNGVPFGIRSTKHSKSQSISIAKGKLKNVKFCIGDAPIPTVSEQPIQSLGRWYDASLRNTYQVQQIRQDITNRLENINKTLLPGKLKLWCLQFGLFPQVMWPLTIYEVPITTVEKMEQTITLYLKKWLGVPRCLTNISLLWQRGP